MNLIGAGRSRAGGKGFFPQYYPGLVAEQFKLEQGQGEHFTCANNVCDMYYVFPQNSFFLVTI